MTSTTAIMIGDTGGDILAGKRAGCLTCGVTYGFGTAAEVAGAGPDLIIRRPGELLTCLNRRQELEMRIQNAG